MRASRTLGACLVFGLFAVPAYAQMQMSVPNVCPAATKTAIADGAWGSPATWSGGSVPSATDSVSIPQGRTVTGSGDVGCVTVNGTWNFSGTFTFDTIQVEATGDFSTTQPFDGVIRDGPATDPEQYGKGIIIDNGRAYWKGVPRTTWVEHTDIAAGDTVLHLRTAPVNWQPGETVIVFDTRRGQNCAVGCTKGAQREVKTIAAVNGSDVTVTTPFQFAHTSVGSPYPSMDGTTKRVYPWATHIGGASKFRSQNPNGTRGHFIAIAHSDIWIENVTFDQMGRTKMGGTTNAPGGANQIGRYPVHMHHLVGRGSQSNGRAFTLSGLEVNTSPRFGIVIHKSSFGLIQDSAVYDVPGAHFYYEDGDEYENITQRNSAVFGVGQGGREDITSGFGFFYRGPWNHTIDNRSANHFNSQGTEAAYGFKYFPKYLNNVLVPAAPGQMPSITKNSYTQGAITEFRGNTCFADESCFTFWWVNTMPFYQEGAQRSLIKDLTFVRIPEKGVFQYEGVRMTFDGMVGRDFYRGWAGQDYIFKHGEIRNVDFQTCDYGMELSPITLNTELLVENSQFGCSQFNLAPMLNWTSAPTAYGGMNAQTQRRFRNIHALVGKAYTLKLANGSRNYTSRQVTFVEDHEGNTADDFQWFAPGSAPSDLVPQHAPVGCTVGTTCSRVGSPAANLTNAQNWSQYGLWFMGAQLCANPQTSSAFDGFACGTVSPPPPTCSFTVTQSTTSVPAAGGQFTASVTASGGTCTWTASGSAGLSVAPTAGTGSGSVTLTASANTGTTSRTLTATVAGQPVSVTQAAPAPQPIDCVVSAWSAWGTCDPSTSTQTRTRTILTQPANGGQACPALTETQACTPPPPPPPPPPTTPTGTGLATPTFRVKGTCPLGCARTEFWVAANGGQPALQATDTTVDAAGNYVWAMLVEPVTYTVYAIVVDVQGQRSTQIPLPGK